MHHHLPYHIRSHACHTAISVTPCHSGSHRSGKQGPSTGRVVLTLTDPSAWGLFAATDVRCDMALVDTTNAANPSHILPASPDAVVDSLRDLVTSAYLNHEPASVQIRAGALFARLKALNRSANAATRTHKQSTAETRHDMDQTYLGLQNLLYEKRHLEREIEKCKQFA